MPFSLKYLQERRFEVVSIVSNFCPFLCPLPESNSAYILLSLSGLFFVCGISNLPEFAIFQYCRK